MKNSERKLIKEVICSFTCTTSKLTVYLQVKDICCDKFIERCKLKGLLRDKAILPSIHLVCVIIYLSMVFFIVRMECMVFMLSLFLSYHYLMLLVTGEPLDHFHLEWWPFSDRGLILYIVAKFVAVLKICHSIKQVFCCAMYNSSKTLVLYNLNAAVMIHVVNILSDVWAIRRCFRFMYI